MKKDPPTPAERATAQVKLLLRSAAADEDLHQRVPLMLSLIHDGADLGALTPPDNTAIIFQVAYHLKDHDASLATVTRAALQQGMAPDVSDSVGVPILQRVVSLRCPKTAREVLAAGASPDRTPSWAKATPLNTACQQDMDADLIADFLIAGAKPAHIAWDNPKAVASLHAGFDQLVHRPSGQERAVSLLAVCLTEGGATGEFAARFLANMGATGP